LWKYLLAYFIMSIHRSWLNFKTLWAFGEE